LYGAKNTQKPKKDIGEPDLTDIGEPDLTDIGELISF